MTTMKLSEAIRLGAMLKPQSEGDLIKAGRTCALGAAADASGLLAGKDGRSKAQPIYDALQLLFPILDVRTADPTSGMDRRVLNIVYMLNDGHRWTREQIADWVETIERQQESKTQEAQTETPVPA